MENNRSVELIELVLVSLRFLGFRGIVWLMVWVELWKYAAAMGRLLCLDGR